MTQYYTHVGEVAASQATQHPIRSLCEALEVSASGYYDWSNRQAHPGPRAQENAQLVQKIVQIHQAIRQTYGLASNAKVSLGRTANCNSCECWTLRKSILFENFVAKWRRIGVK
jgi:hypothetical protein